jgi:hypothetical protein
MKKMKTKLFLIAVISAFTFTSCEKCKDCEASYEFINGANEADYDDLAVFLGYTSFQNFFNSTDSINQLNMEYCEDDLTDKQDYSEEYDDDGDGTNDIRYFFDCK